MNEQQYINLLFQRMQNNISSAATLVKDIDRKFPKSYILQYYSGYYYEKINDLEKAVHKFKRAIDIEPLFSPPYFNLASYYIKNNQPLEAERILIKIFGKTTLDMTSGSRKRIFKLLENVKICSMLGPIYISLKMQCV